MGGWFGSDKSYQNHSSNGNGDNQSSSHKSSPFDDLTKLVLGVGTVGGLGFAANKLYTKSKSEEKKTSEVKGQNRDSLGASSGSSLLFPFVLIALCCAGVFLWFMLQSDSDSDEDDEFDDDLGEDENEL